MPALRPTVRWSEATTERLAALRPDDVLALPDGTRHVLGSVTFDRDEDGTITRAAARSLTADRWINLLTGQLK